MIKNGGDAGYCYHFCSNMVVKTHTCPKLVVANWADYAGCNYYPVPRLYCCHKPPPLEKLHLSIVSKL